MNSLVLFLVGHALAITETDERPFIFKKARTGNIVGGALVVFGILLSTWREDAMPLNLFVELDSIVYFPAQSPFHFIGMIAAIFIFLGIYAAPGLRAFFALRLWQKLGRISFALYLLHFPMLLTVTAVLQVWLDGFFIYPVAAVAAFIVGLTITYMAAVLFTKWIDDPAIRLGRFVESPRLIFSASRSS